ncbi:MAG: zf-HC2 domain-containing protein [Acutalibacter sp.]|jgi:hypothetical protein
MKVPCTVVKDLLPLYHDNVCSPETAALVEEHLQECESCQKEFHKLQEAPTTSLTLDTIPQKRETKFLEGLNQMKRMLRKKWVKIAALAVVATLVVTIGLAFFANTYRIVPQAEEILQGVSVEDGLLTVDLETPFRLSSMTNFVPSTSEVQGEGESILLITTSFTPSDWISGWFHGTVGQFTGPEGGYPWELIYPLTEEAWNDKSEENAAQLEAQLRANGYPEEEIEWQCSSVRELPHGEIDKVYYFNATQYGWESNEEAQKALEEHGTLLWTAEDGVVYQP